MENINSYKDLTLLINTGEKVKKELENSIEDIESYFRRIEGPKGLKHKTSYEDYDTIQGERDTNLSVGYGKLLEELHRLESMLYLQNCNLERYYRIKVGIDDCVNATTSVTIKVSMLRRLGISQEQVSEMVEKSTRTIKRMDKKEREKINITVDCSGQ